jgi:hypothetical protein
MLVAALTGCAHPVANPPAAAPAAEPAAPSAADTVYRWLQGRFDSAEQAAAHPDDYMTITLAMCAVTVPGVDRALYVEQAVPGSAPYRQRVYAVRDGDPPATQAVTTIYELVDPTAFVGACDRPAPTIAADAITEKVGCGVTLTFADGAYTGATAPNACPSALRGATWASSEVTLTPDLLESWDRGWDAAGAHVWGATEGPYRFVRADGAGP